LKSKSHSSSPFVLFNCTPAFSLQNTSFNAFQASLLLMRTAARYRAGCRRELVSTYSTPCMSNGSLSSFHHSLSSIVFNVLVQALPSVLQISSSSNDPRFRNGPLAFESSSTPAGSSRSTLHSTSYRLSMCAHTLKGCARAPDMPRIHCSFIHQKCVFACVAHFICESF
jgi:hypothetical protein